MNLIPCKEGSIRLASRPSFVAPHLPGWGPHPKGARRVRAQAQAKTEQQQDRIAIQTIDELDRNYCDDFQCESSPAVEQFVRSFARDTQRLRYGRSLFQPDVQYSDGFRSFKGNEKYAGQTWLADNIQKPQVTVLKMRMLDKATAEIDWTVSGTFYGAQTTIPVTSVIKMNLLTGRVVDHKETWDISRVPQPAATLASLNRKLWSVRTDLKEATSKVQTKVDDVLSSMDDTSANEVYRDPTDPTKFFQGSDNSQWNDYVSYAFLAALVWLMYRAFAELNALG